MGSRFFMFIIAGPTAVGKSAFAVEFAERCNGEILNADAFQIYAGLPLLTAKPEPELLARVAHHLIGVVPLQEEFDVASYARVATAAIAEVTARKRVPVVVGGSGLYLRALSGGLAEGLPAPDPALRDELSALPLPEALGRLQRLDPEGVARIDQLNRRRVVRALEVCILGGRPFSSFRSEPRRDIRGVVLLRDKEELHQRINSRVEDMFSAGVVAEVATAGAVSRTASQAIGLRPCLAVHTGAMDRVAAMAEIKQMTRQYAKRQLTWFRREEHLRPIELTRIRMESAVDAALAHLDV